MKDLWIYNQPLKQDMISVGAYSLNAQHIEEILVNRVDNQCFNLHIAENSTLVLKPQWLEASLDADGKKVVSGQESSASTQEITYFRPGKIDYTIPDSMKQGEATRCLIRIADENVTIQATSSDSEQALVSICDEMSVKITDKSEVTNFTIVSASPETQYIEKGKPTDWAINVTPLRAGSFPLSLQVICHHPDEEPKTVLSLRKLIHVDKSVPLKKILFIAVGAESGLKLGKESNEIWEELEMAQLRDDFTYVKFFEVTSLQFDRALAKEQPTIVHFSGHASRDGIFLIDSDQDESELVANAQIVGSFKALLAAEPPTAIECTIWNACLTKELAQDLSSDIKTVVGSLKKIGDDKAIRFSQFFYRALGNGSDYRQAFKIASKAINPDDDPTDEEDDLLICLPE